MAKKRKFKLSQDHRKLILAGILVLASALFLLKAASGGTASLPSLFTKPSPTPSPLPTPTPTPSPTPTPTPSPKPPSVPTTSCGQFKPESGQAVVTVNLVSNTGSITGDTVVRLIPTNACPNASPAQEHWMRSGEMSWTSAPVNPSKYRVEVANGNYQGVISRNVDLLSGHYVLSINVINN